MANSPLIRHLFDLFINENGSKTDTEAFVAFCEKWLSEHAILSVVYSDGGVGFKFHDGTVLGIAQPANFVDTGHAMMITKENYGRNTAPTPTVPIFGG